MTHPLRIAVADDEADVCDFFQCVLPQQGHTVVAVAKTGRELIERCRATRPDLIITDIKMPDLDGIEAVRVLTAETPVPVILVSAYHDPATLARADGDFVMGYLVKPFTETDLPPAINVAMRRFEQFQALRKEAGDLRQALEDRKVIEQAKGIITRRLRVDEPEAFRRMRRLSSDRNWKMVAIARKVLEAEEIFDAIENSHGRR